MRALCLVMFTLLTMDLLSLRAAAPTVSREDLKKTLMHMQQLARDLQGDLDAATAAKMALGAQLGKAEKSLVSAGARADDLQAQVDEQSRRLEAAELAVEIQKKRADREHFIAQKNARERDVFVWFFAGAGALAVTFAVGPALARALSLNPLWSLGAYAALFLLSLGAFYALVRIILAKIIHTL